MDKYLQPGVSCRMRRYSWRFSGVPIPSQQSYSRASTSSKTVGSTCEKEKICLMVYVASGAGVRE
ncbi:hypothetical protein E2C01_040799 [Portunus trituberculatus]|uniref:Uncharacterized protein n=1 Tax=Portunus trituberculatus TaxID=210409 RepID=A0A5B7FNJ9_PORTR|nr:hypothetical protein [Portunus trituberculatus]